MIFRKIIEAVRRSVQGDRYPPPLLMPVPRDPPDDPEGRCGRCHASLSEYDAVWIAQPWGHLRWARVVCRGCVVAHDSVFECDDES